jgi:prepilin-type N-terminal cleavage/methylation domain-containing protein/prepilin-type processing-associated H-X9-DG protein
MRELAGNRRRGFTLIELLVVIAIIAILAAILFPVFAQAREAARRTACVSNCKQIGTALNMYAEDYDENLPGMPFSTRTGNPYYAVGWSYGAWVPMVQPYIKNAGIFHCPSAPAGYGLLGPAGSQISVTYGINEWIEDTEKGGWNSMSALANGGTGGAGVADIAIVADSVYPGIFNDWSPYQGTANGAPAKGGSFGMARQVCGNNLASNVCQPRHSDYGASYVFGDGHAKFISGGKIQGASNNTVNGVVLEYPVVYPNAKSIF